MNRLERAIASVSPGWAARRAADRMRVLAYTTAYEAARPSRLRKWARDFGSGTTIARGGLKPLRDYARNLERNHDIANGALNTLVQNIIGAHGITVEPQPMRDGVVDAELQKQLQALWLEWCEWPEVSWTHSWASSQRMLCRSWIRDGEVLFQMLPGSVPGLQHGSRTPFSIELIEADLLDHTFDDIDRGIVQGVERNAWNRPVAYWVFKQHPGDYNLLNPIDRKRVGAEQMYHLKLINRIAQVRGISVFGSVCIRLEDIKDYEDSERIAAKVAASMAAYIKKGQPDEYATPIDPVTGQQRAARDLKFVPGMIFDDLLPGEDIGTIDAKRPNPNVEPYRNGQLRATAAGVGISYSSLSKNYDGSYSAQRQELVEQRGAYEIIGDEFTAQCVRPVYQQFVNACVLAGLVKTPRGMTARDLAHAMFVLPAMPWIDPLKEASAWSLMESRGYMAAPEIIRRRGGNPADVLSQEANWRKRAADLGLDFTASVPLPTRQPFQGDPGTPAPTQTPETATAPDTGGDETDEGNL